MFGQCPIFVYLGLRSILTLGSIASITYCNLNIILFKFFICYFFISINSICYKKMVEPMVLMLCELAKMGEYGVLPEYLLLLKIK